MTLLTYNTTCKGFGPARESEGTTRISGDGTFNGTGLFVGVGCCALAVPETCQSFAKLPIRPPRLHFHESDIEQCEVKQCDYVTHTMRVLCYEGESKYLAAHTLD